MKVMGFGGPKWTTTGWPSLTVGGVTPGAMPRWWRSNQIATATAGDGSATATCPMVDDH